MKLAAALAERADLQRRLAQLQTRLNNNAKVQEGEKPAEDPDMLLSELDNILVRLEELICRINLTNSLTRTDGKSITELLARRDGLKLRFSAMRSFLDTASQKVDRYSRAEIKIVSTVSVSGLQKEIDEVSKELRELDEKLQEFNWTTELLDKQ